MFVALFPKSKKRMQQIKNLDPVKGAASYFAALDDNQTPCVWMRDIDGFLSVIDTAKTIEKAREKALKWQEKENKAVLKSQKR